MLLAARMAFEVMSGNIFQFIPCPDICLAVAAASRIRMMGQILSNGELQLTDEECERLSLPPNSVVPVENVEEFQAKLQSIYDDDVKKLARQIGTKPAEEPYPGAL